MDHNKILEKKKQLITKLESWQASNLIMSNWDSYDASPITNETIDAAIYIAQLIAGEAITTVVPTASGAIEFSDDHETIIVTVATIPENRPPQPAQAAASPPSPSQILKISKTVVFSALVFWATLSLLNYIFGK